MPVKQGAIEGASQGNTFLKELLKDMIRWQEGVATHLGYDPLPQGATTTQQLPPPVARISVKGGGGKFVITLTPPVGAKSGAIEYRVQSSSTLPFESSTSITTYGPSPSTSFEVVQPNTTLHWRVQARYTGSGYSSQTIVGPIDSGAAPINQVVTQVTDSKKFTLQGPPSPSTEWTVTHNLGTSDVVVAVRRIISGEQIGINVVILGDNGVTVSTPTEMSENDFVVVVRG